MPYQKHRLPLAGVREVAESTKNRKSPNSRKKKTGPRGAPNGVCSARLLIPSTLYKTCHKIKERDNDPKKKKVVKWRERGPFVAVRCLVLQLSPHAVLSSKWRLFKAEVTMDSHAPSTTSDGGPADMLVFSMSTKYHLVSHHLPEPFFCPLHVPLPTG